MKIIACILGGIFAIEPPLMLFDALLAVPAVGLSCIAAAAFGCIFLAKSMKKDSIRKSDAGFLDGFIAAALGGLCGGVVGGVVTLCFGGISDQGLAVGAILTTPFILLQCYLIMCALYDEKTEKKEVSEEASEETYQEPEVSSGYTASDLLRVMIDKAPDYSTERAIEDLLQAYEEIEDTLKDNPDYENMDDIRDLRTGYLPKILELSDKLVQGKYSPEMKIKVTDAIYVCTCAFRNINKKMIAADDLQTAGDLAVLKDSLTRKGLLDSDFKLEKKDYEKDERDIIDLLIIKYLVERKKEEEQAEKKDEPYIFVDADYYTDRDDDDDYDSDSDSDSYDSYEDDSDDGEDDDSYSYDDDDYEEREESDFEDWLFNNDDERW